MRQGSAADAIGLAFARTRDVMAHPFRLGFFLKVALVGALTQPGFFSAVLSYPINGAQIAGVSRMPHQQQLLTKPFGVVALGILIAVLAVSLVVALLLFYVFCRMRFTLLDMVLYRTRSVREAWGRYGAPTRRYYGLLTVLYLAFLLLTVVLAGPFVVTFVRAVLHSAVPGQSSNPAAFIGLLFPLVGVFVLLGLLWAIADTVMEDFLLPPMAIEDASIELAWSRFKTVLQQHTGQWLLYLLLRFVLTIGLTWVLMALVFTVLLAFAAAGVGLGVLLYHLLWASGLALRVLFIAVVSGMALLVLGVYLLLFAAVYGVVATFRQSYALFFYGSYYRELGKLLYPPGDGDGRAAAFAPSVPPMPPLEEPPPVW